MSNLILFDVWHHLEYPGAAFAGIFSRANERGTANPLRAGNEYSSNSSTGYFTMSHLACVSRFSGMSLKGFIPLKQGTSPRNRKPPVSYSNAKLRPGLPIGNFSQWKMSSASHTSLAEASAALSSILTAFRPQSCGSIDFSRDFPISSRLAC